MVTSTGSVTPPVENYIEQTNPELVEGCNAYNTLNSVRLFLARPSGVSLVSTGFVSP